MDQKKTNVILNSTAAVVACIKPVLDQGIQHSCMESGGYQEPPLLTEKLLIVEDFTQKNCFSLKVQLQQVGYTPVDSPKPPNIMTTQIYLKGYFLKRLKVGVCRKLGQIWRSYVEKRGKIRSKCILCNSQRISKIYIKRN